MTPQLSIVTAVYNHGQYLQQCIDSVRHQSEKDIEHIIVIDGATDDSLEIADRASTADERVIVVRNARNQGLAYSQNFGILHATAPWVMKVDADDWISPTYVAEILAAADADPRRNVIFSPAHLFGTQESVWRYPAFRPDRMIDTFFIAGCGAFRRDLWASVGGYDETMRFAEDWDLHIRAHLAVGLVPHQLSQPLWHYRQHAGPRASHEGMKRLPDLQAYWRGHTRESVLAQSRSWGNWLNDRAVAAA
jgi:glycosyltransferase involved in cell wall biosynthesis